MGVYQPVLCVLNMVLLISSTAMLYLGSILVNFYLLPNLDLVTANFAVVPYLILVIGSCLLIFSFVGVLAAVSKSKLALIIYSILLGLVFILQLASIFTSLELRNQMVARVLNAVPTDVFQELERYWIDPDVKFKWDTIQRDFQCCGVLQHNTGYKDWQRWGSAALVGSAASRSRQGVPDSCCLVETENCGLGDEEGIFNDIYAGYTIYTHGCMTILENRLERDIQPVLLAYIGCAVVLALLQILSVVLSASFVASINRKSKGSNSDRMGMYQHPSQAIPGTVGYEGSLYQTTKPFAATMDSGFTGSLRGSLKSNMGTETEMKPITATPLSVRRLEDASHRSSIYIEPSNEEGTQI